MTQNSTTCWNCSKNIIETDLFCPSCSKIQPPSQVSHFVRLGVSADFDLGIKNLEVAYFALQTKLHPDRFASKSEKEKMFSMQQSTSVNEAYEILRTPLTRAEYMLKLEGVVVNADNATIKPSQEILMESLEAREKLSGELTAEAIRKMSIEALENKLSAIENIKQGFIDGNLKKTAQETIKLRYLEKLIEEIKQVSDVRS